MTAGYVAGGSPLWPCGCSAYPEQAVQHSHEALRLAQDLAHPFSLVFALSHGAILHEFRREAQAARERAEAVLTLVREQGFQRWEAWEPSQGAGRWSSRGREQRGSPRYARV